MGQPPIIMQSGTTNNVTIPGGENDQYKNELKNMSTEDLLKELEKSNLTPEQKKAILAELAARKDKELSDAEASGDKEAGADKKRLQELMKKVANGEKLTEAETKELATLLGITEQQVDEMTGNTGEGGKE